MTLTPEERRRIRSQLACSLANLSTFRVYWLPAHRTIACRSLAVRRAFRVPAGAVELGVYAAGGPSAPEILRDLEELIDSRSTPAVSAA